MDMITLAMAKAYADSQRLGHAETERVNVMEPLTVRLEFGFVHAPSNIEFFQVGKSYAVSWNGVEYICIAQKLEQDGITGIAVGNCAQFGGTENGEPFIVIKMPDALAVGDWLSTGVEETTVQLSIDEINETIHTIDPKFIPGPQEIDLRKYTHFLSTGMDRPELNDVVLELFANGGGTILCPDVDDAFWKDINTNRPIQFIFDVSAMDDLEEGSILLKCNDQGKTFESEDCCQISCRYVGIISGVVTRVTILFERANLNETGTYITVIIENLNIPQSQGVIG